MDNNRVEIQGTVDNITYFRPDTGFTVFDMESDDELITAVGVLAQQISVGEKLHLYGRWDVHASFGNQFRIDQCIPVLPTTAAEMLNYLSSGTVKGIGKATALKIVDAFGEQTMDVLENHPERLATIKGISKSKAEKICEEFRKEFAVREVVIALGALGITPAESLAAYKVFGASAVQKVQENPYILCGIGARIGFERADQIAGSMPNPPKPMYRMKAGILYVLRHNLFNSGHTCVPRDRLLEPSASLLSADSSQIENAIDELLEERKIVQCVMRERKFLFLPEVYHAEKSAAERLQVMLMFPPAGANTTEQDIDKLEEQTGIHYEQRQRQAILTAMQKGVLILTGGPGTGKTTTLNGILTLMEKNGLDVALTAPTGRAAKRMSEVTGKEAKTIHRLLEVEWTENEQSSFARNIQNPIEADAVIVDELSMVDIVLFSNLLDALPLGCRLIMVGDCDQLPPVGAGCVLHDLIQSKLLPTVQLEEVFRQAMESLIVSNAHRIVHGDYPILNVHDNDFFFMERRQSSQVAQTVQELCSSRLPKAYGYSPLMDIQVLCPSRKGECGTVNLNRILQEVLNPASKEKAEFESRGRILRVGDKVMQTKNNYNLQWTRGSETGTGAFNGDIGIIKEIKPASAVINVLYEDRLATYSFEAASELEHAYAVTVHKSQGSEFEAVVMPVFHIVPQLSYRNLLYTAVTRAKKKLILVGSREQIFAMVDNNKKTRRFSALKTFLLGEDEI